jgi:hypothetical protein
MDIQLIDKRILITGGAGFIGSNLSEYLLDKGCGVVCLDNLATGSIENVNHLSTNPNFTFVEGDIRNITDCHAAVKGVDYVLHQAALGSVPRSIKDPITSNEVNVSGFLNMLIAGTKWNFLPFKPGLVGGHCIGVDPYYLAQKAQEYGYHPEIILAGRRLNDSMGNYVASEVVKLMIAKDIHVKEAKVLVLGITFKENCPDVRNTKAVDVIAALKEFGMDVTIYDPWANKDEVLHEYKLISTQEVPTQTFDAVVLTVAHTAFLDMNFDSLTNKNHVLYDVKNILPTTIKHGGL